MSTRNREKEVKLQVRGYTFDRMQTLLHFLYKDRSSRMVYGKSADTYWTLGPDAFVRVRERNGAAILTVKRKDRDEEGLDRLEIDLDVEATPAKVKKFLSVVHGKPAGTVAKEYYVYWLEGEEHTTISVYRVEKDLYLEIEAAEMDRVLELEKEIVRNMAGDCVERAAGSLYELYILPGGKK